MAALDNTLFTKTKTTCFLDSGQLRTSGLQDFRRGGELGSSSSPTLELLDRRMPSSLCWSPGFPLIATGTPHRLERRGGWVERRWREAVRDHDHRRRQRGVTDYLTVLKSQLDDSTVESKPALAFPSFISSGGMNYPFS